MKYESRYPRIRIDLAKIIHNARIIVEASNALKIDVYGVSKSCQGDPDIARAMCAGGVCGIADSRIQNLEKLHKASFSNLLMLRQPLKDEVEDVIRLTQACLVSDLYILRLLSAAAGKLNRKYKVILMVETGEMREGILPEELLEFAASAFKLPNIEIWGIGTNFACFPGKDTVPSRIDVTSNNLEILCKAAVELKCRLGYSARVVSGGNSSAWRMIESATIPPQINQLRMGEAILLGQETLFYKPIINTFQDSFILESEVIEVREKPLSLIDNGLPGTRKQILVALGKQDLGAGFILPYRPGLEVVKISSDHLVLGAKAGLNIKSGDILSFKLDYYALVGAMTSPFVQKVYYNSDRGSVHSLSNTEVKIPNPSPKPILSQSKE